MSWIKIPALFRKVFIAYDRGSLMSLLCFWKAGLLMPRQQVVQPRHSFLSLCLVLLSVGSALLSTGQVYAHSSALATHATNPPAICKGVTIQQSSQGELCNGLGPGAATSCWANNASEVAGLTLGASSTPPNNSPNVLGNRDGYGDNSTLDIYQQNAADGSKNGPMLGTLTIWYSQTCGTNWLNFQSTVSQPGQYNAAGLQISMSISIVGSTPPNPQNNFNLQADGSVHTKMIYSPNAPVEGSILLETNDASPTILGYGSIQQPGFLGNS